jgi:hypothetical protein
MKVEFRRTAQRRYAIKIRRGYSTLEMNPAPGYDPEMPHDLLHLIVESELGLRRGIFGQVAAGGHAGTFHAQTPSSQNPRETARNRRRAARRGAKLRTEGRDEAAQSERATYICLYEWLARSAEIERRRLAGQMASTAAHIRATQPPSEARALGEPVLRRILGRLDELNAGWRVLEVGQSLVVEWPACLADHQDQEIAS